MSVTHDVRAVLVIDDDEAFRFFLSDALGSAGYPIVAVDGAAAARAALAQGRFALILADLHLPDGSGLEVLAEARRRDPLSVGVVLTGRGSGESALQALRQGAYDYLVKPFGADALLAAVRRGVEHHRLRVALVQKTAQLDALEAELHQKARLLQDVSHELRNPLSVVFGYSSFLLKQRHECKPEDVERSLQSIHNNAERLSHLLEELLDSSRLSSRKIELHRQDVPAVDLASEVVASFALQAQKQGVNLRLDGACADAVYADARRVHQIFANLLSNALKFTPEGGSITVSAEPGEGCARFCVADTGCGVSAEDLPRLFERFYQARGTKAHHSGLGLGLEISKGLVELHGGHIWAESAPGRGSRFLFTLPLSVGAPQPDRALTRRPANP